MRDRVLLVSILALAGCHLVRFGALAPWQGTPEQYTSICEIQSSPTRFVGKTVRVHGIYEANFVEYSFIRDTECGGGHTNIVGAADFARPHGDDSVLAFFKAWKKRCDTYSADLCPLSHQVDATVALSRDSEGQLIAEFQHMYFFKPLR